MPSFGLGFWFDQAVRFQKRAASAAIALRSFRSLSTPAKSPAPRNVRHLVQLLGALRATLTTSLLTVTFPRPLSAPNQKGPQSGKSELQLGPDVPTPPLRRCPSLFRRLKSEGKMGAAFVHLHLSGAIIGSHLPPLPAAQPVSGPGSPFPRPWTSSPPGMASLQSRCPLHLSAAPSLPTPRDSFTLPENIGTPSPPGSAPLVFISPLI